MAKSPFHDDSFQQRADRTARETSEFFRSKEGTAIVTSIVTRMSKVRPLCLHAWNRELDRKRT